MRTTGPVFVTGLVLAFTGIEAAGADEQPLARTQLAKLGKAATALVELDGVRGQPFGQGFGSAFCVHRAGLFVTNDHVVHPRSPFPGNQQSGERPITLVINPGQKGERSYAARVIRSDKDLDLALLRVDGNHDFPALSLGDDEKLEELMDVVAFGFPYGTGIDGAIGTPIRPRTEPGSREYPSVSINSGSITALRRKEGNLERIQLDATINPGNSGGPVLDKDGKVVGVVVSMAVAQRLGRTGISYAIPVNHLSRFLARPDIEFDPPVLHPANVHKPVVFEAKVVPLLPSKTPLTVDLILKPARGREQSYRMEANGINYRASAVPLPPPTGPRRVRLLAHFDNGVLNAVTVDRAFQVGERSVPFSDLRSIQLKPAPRVVLGDGKAMAGSVSGLDAVSVQLGDQALTVNLAEATDIKFAPAVDTDQVWYTLLVRQGDREVHRQTESLVIEGLLPVPAGAAAQTGINRPTLDGNSSMRKLAAPVADVAVGGAGRYLVLHLPSLHKLAVFDVSSADVTGYIPVKEDSARFTAGLEDVVVLLPGAGTMERWSLKTLERDISTALPIKGVIKAVAMGAASKGPLLVHWAVGTQDLDHAGFSLINVERMKLQEEEIKVYPALGNSSRDIVHLRASANGKVFGMWCTSHSPSGVGVIMASDSGVQSYYAHWSAGYVVPSADGKWLYTRSGRCPPEVSLTQMQDPQGEPALPACHGDYYLSLPSSDRPGQGPMQRFPPRRPGAPQPSQPPAEKSATIAVHSLRNDKPIATVPHLDLPAPGEEWIKHDLTFDKRIHLIPEARLIITIPASNDRLVLYGYGS
jgi:S1-C subfamily serine protease